MEQTATVKQAKEREAASQQPEADDDAHTRFDLQEIAEETKAVPPESNDQNGNSDHAPATNESHAEQSQDGEEKKSLYTRAGEFYAANEFLFLILLAIVVAKLYPPLGAKYLAPEITESWIAVSIIFGE